MNITVVIPNYNGLGILPKSLPVITAHSKKAELILIDDASTDGSAAWVRKNFPEIKCIVNERNIGFARSVNNAVSIAAGQIIILFNHDVYPDAGYLEKVSEYFKDPYLFALGFMDKSLEKEKSVLRGRGVGSFYNGFLHHSRGNIDKTNTLWVSGGSGAFRQEVWLKLGGFAEIYAPFYWEDIDLSYVASKSGYRIEFTSEIIVTHEHEKGAIRRNYRDEQIRTVSYRNQILFVWLNITSPQLLFQHFKYLPILLLKAFGKNDMIFIRAFFSAVRLLPQVISIRKRRSKLFKISDEKILEQFNGETK